MVKGLEIFKNHFKGFEKSYVLIGGTASSIVMEAAGINFRATKDLDIVLCIESLDPTFARKFWDFIEEGSYTNRQRSTGRKIFYRFHSPKNANYPSMLELFSRVPDSLEIYHNKSTLTPIPIGENISSLSAILLEPDYYNFIHKNKIIISELSVIGPEILIPLKARAWLDLTERKNNGEKIDSRDIRKHKNDIFRLFLLLPRNFSIECPQLVKKDLSLFTEKIVTDSGLNLKALGIKTLSLNEILARLKIIYAI